MLYLQIGDDRVLHIFFLFLQEVETHGVQCVWAQFIVPEKNLRNKPIRTSCKFLPKQRSTYGVVNVYVSKVMNAAAANEADLQ